MPCSILDKLLNKTIRQINQAVDYPHFMHQFSTEWVDHVIIDGGATINFAGFGNKGGEKQAKLFI